MNPDLNTPFLELDGIRKSFRINGHVLHVLKGISLRAGFEEWLALAGASGSGKTTLLDIIGTISVPDAGKVVIGGTDTSSLSRRAQAAFRRKNIGFVFQAYHILPELNILENAALPMQFAGMKRKDAMARAEELLVSVGLKDRLRHRPNELSGGEQQRTAIARALGNSPRLLLADEPTGTLDSVTGGGILELFEAIRAKRETTIVMVTHDPSVAARADRTVRMVDGTVRPD